MKNFRLRQFLPRNGKGIRSLGKQTFCKTRKSTHFVRIHCMKNHMFSPVVRPILVPTILRPNAKCHSDYRKFTFSLNLLETRLAKRPEFKIQIILRFGRLSDYGINWDVVPNELIVFLNGRSIEPFRSPFDLLPAVDFSTENTLELYWCNLDAISYILTLDLLSIKHPQLFQDYLLKKVTDSESALNNYLELTSGLTDSELQITSQQVSLLCPVSKDKMRLPGLGIDCKHIQCFDAVTYFEMNLHKGKWLCPICRNLLYPDCIIIDGFWREVIKLCPLDTVIVYNDGSWSAPPQTQEPTSLSVDLTE